MERTVLAYVDLDGVLHLAGRLWARARGGKESALFEYDKSWLENPLRFPWSLLCSSDQGRTTRPTTCRCSALSVIPPRIVGAVP